MGIDYEKEGRIVVVTINRPEVRNAFDTEAVYQFHKAIVDFRDDPDLWVCIITGSGGKAFCAGSDIKSRLPSMKESRDTYDMSPPTPQRGLELWKPLIAAINGVATGGGLEIALACDIRIASENARLGSPEVKLGLIPGLGGTQRLPRMIPWCKAAEMLLMGDLIDAQEAYRIGLVNKVVTLEELMPTARKWAEALCQAAPLAVRAAKEAMIRGYSMTLEDGMQLELSLVKTLQQTGDFNEGIAAFKEKRKPIYKAK